MLIKRHELWRKKYRGDRYLEYLSAEELAARSRDVINNQITLTENGKIGFVPMDEWGDYIMQVWTHVLEECQLRNYPFPYPLDQVRDWQFPTYGWPGLQKAVDAYKARNLVIGNYLIKYGKLKYLQMAFENGKIRIAPASYYSDPSLNQAVRDSELELSIYYRPSKPKLKLDVGVEDLKAPIRPVGNITYALKSSTNYYVYCLASEYSYRLFGDFEADACLIINNPQGFTRMLIDAVEHRLPNWKGFATSITYIDPINTSKEELDIFFCKHFSFAYQKEYRVIWLPPSNEMALQPIEIEVGSLKDYCELISLQS
jgi:hypothetical protein